MSGCLHIASSKSNPKEPPAFCDCKEKCSDLSQVLRCACGEEEKVYDWIWDEENKSHSTKIELEGREIHFHPVYSSGTAAVKGNKPFLPGNIYYWEIKVLTQLYGTDVMIGVGTNKVDFGASSLYFCSLLGSDGESWGFSYHGYTQHGDSKKLYGPRFGQGSLLGVYLDTWKGTLEFYLNHRPLGVAYSSLQDKILYPMMCSTAAKSKFRLIYTSSCQSSLQLLCLRSLSKRADLVKEARKIPFLRRMIEDELWWLFRRLVSSNSSSLRSSKNDLESESESQDDTDSDYDDLLIQRLNEYVTKAPDPR